MYIYFNNKYSGLYNVCIVDFNNSEIVKQIGGSHTITTEKEISYNNQSFYKEKEHMVHSAFLFDFYR